MTVDGQSKNKHEDGRRSHKIKMQFLRLPFRCADVFNMRPVSSVALAVISRQVVPRVE